MSGFELNTLSFLCSQWSLLFYPRFRWPLNQLRGELVLKCLISALHCLGNVRVEDSILQHQVELCLRMWLCAAFEISTSNCFPTLQTFSMDLEIPNVTSSARGALSSGYPCTSCNVWTHRNHLSGQWNHQAQRHQHHIASAVMYLMWLQIPISSTCMYTKSVLEPPLSPFTTPLCATYAAKDHLKPS